MQGRENSSRVKKGGQTYQHCFSERRSESEAGPASGTSVSLEHHTQTEQVLEEHTLRQQVEGQTGREERCDVLLSRKPSSLQKSCHCMKC